MKICIFMKIRAKHLEKIFQNLHFFWNSWVGGGGLRGGNVRPRGSPLSPNLKNWKKDFGTIKSRFFGIFDRNARNFGQKSSKNRDFWPFLNLPRITPRGSSRVPGSLFLVFWHPRTKVDQSYGHLRCSFSRGCPPAGGEIQWKFGEIWPFFGLLTGEFRFSKLAP